MIAAATLGDVVEQCAQVDDLGLGQLLHDRRDQRQFVVELRHGEAPRVADHEQRVRIDRVGVEQVVLHAADDAAEGGYVAAEHAVDVHAPQLVRHAARRAQDLEEQAVVARVLAELLVDQPQVAPDRTDRIGAHAAQLRMLLQQHEQLEQGRRLACEQVGRAGFEIIVAHLELRGQCARRCVVGEYRLAEQLQQHLVQQLHVHHGAVVALHQLLDRQRVGGIFVAETVRELDLVVEQQPILVPPGEHVQAEAHLPQEGLRLLQAPQFRRRQEAMGHQFIERLRAEVAFRHPADGLDVAQSAGPGLHVGFEVVGGVVRLQVPLLLLAHFGGEEIAHRPDAIGRERRAHCRQQRGRAREPARFEQRGHHAHIGEALLEAVVDRAHAVADLETDVPEEGDELFDLAALALAQGLRHQHQEIDIGIGVQLRAAIATDCSECELRGELRLEPRMPERSQQHIGEGRTRAHQAFDLFVIAKALLQFLLTLRQQLPEHLGRALAVLQQLGQAAEQWPV